MSLPEISIDRHVLAWMLSASLVLFGLISYQRIGVDRYPQIEFPRISVTTLMPGANPDVIDASITNLIETSINGIPGIEHLQSDSFPGASVTNVTFAFSRDVDVAFNEVQAKVNQVLKDLPDDADPPVVAKMEFGAVPILWITLTGERTLQQLNQYARTVVKKRLENVDGVAEIRLGGQRDRTIRVNLDVDRMNAYGITTQDLVVAFRVEHFQLPGGFLVGHATEQMIKLDLEFHDPAKLESMIVSYRSGAPIRLADIAEIEDGMADYRRLARFNDLPAVGLGIVKISDSNTVAIIDEVRRRLAEEIGPSLPPGISIEIAIDNADLIHDLVDALREHLLLGTLLTALVVWLFLKSLRATVIIAFAIPVSLFGAVAVMYFSGFTFNTLTLLALLLLIGVVVDDAIVVLENVYRHRQHLDPDARSSAIAGANQVVFAVLASTLTLVSIFTPVVFMGGVIGQMFKPFAVVVVTGVMVSWFVSMTLTPMLCARYLVVSDHPRGLYRWLENSFLLLDSGYRWMLRYALRARWIIVALTLAVVVASGYFFGQLGSAFLPQEDEGNFIVSIRTPLGSSLAYTGERLSKVEERLRAHPDVASYFSTIGTGDTGQTHKGSIFVRLNPRAERRTHMYQVIDELRDALAQVPGVKAFPAPPSPIGGQRGEPLQFVVLGPELTEVARLSQQLRQKLETLPELGPLDLDLQLDLPQLVLDIDRTRAAELGLSSRDIAQAVNILAGGLDVAKFNDDPGDGERYDVRLKSSTGSFRAPEDLHNIYLRGRSGDLIRLDTVVTVKEVLGPAVVSRYDLRYSGLFYATPIVSLGEAVQLVEAAAGEMLPRGFNVEMVGRAEEFAKTQTNMISMFVISIILVYMVLASQFNSFLQPLIVMVAQPLAIVGGGAALWVTDMTLNMFSMIGLVLLMGLVAKNSILLIDFTNQLRAEGRGVREALLEACPLRMRPVLMTSLTIIFTMLPVALGLGAGADTSGPLAVAVVGGMVSSTLLTLVVVPAVYALVEEPLARRRKSHADGLNQLPAG